MSSFIINPYKFADPFVPSDVPGLILEIYSTNAVLSGSKVVSVTDTSGSGNDFVQATASKRADIVTGYSGNPMIRFDGVDDIYGINEINTLRTVFLLYREYNELFAYYRPLLGHDTLYQFHRGANKDFFLPGATATDVLNGSLRVNKAAAVYTDEIPTQYSVISLKTTGNATFNNFSSDRNTNDRFIKGDLMALLVYNTAVSDSDILRIENYLTRTFPVINLNMCYEGNSFFTNTYGDFSTLIDTNIYDGGYNTARFNGAVGGSGIGNSTSAAGNYMLETTRYNTMKAQYVAGKKNIATVFEGINDLYYYLTDGMSVADAVNQVYSNFETYVSGLTALGFKVIINTLTPRNNVGTPANYETARQNASNKNDTGTINGKLRADFTVSTGTTRVLASNLSKWANVVLVDCGDDPNFGQAGDENDLTYYDADKVHPTATTRVLLANSYYVPAINYLVL